MRAVVLCFLSCLTADSAPVAGGTASEGEAVQLAEIDTEAVIARWNQAVERCHNHDLDGIVDLFCPDCRADWSNLSRSETTFRILRLYFGNKDGIRSSRIIAYRDSRGRLLAKVYHELPVTATFRGRPTKFVTRWCIGILERPPVGNWCIVTPTGQDDRQFGIGASFQNVRIRVVPNQERITSWSDLTLNVVFENVSQTATVALHPQPSFYLNANTTLVVLNRQSEERKEFGDWYEQIEVRSSPPVSGLTQWLHAIPQPIQLQPGQKKGFIFDLNEVTGGCTALQDGPPGSFDLCVAYDSFLEWNLLPVSFVVWRGRVASNVFRIVVGRVSETPD